MQIMRARFFSLALLAGLAISLATAACTRGEDAKADDPVTKVARAGYWGKDDDWKVHGAMIGKPMPKLALTDWIDGKAVTAEDMKGKIVVLDFWATWCGPCIRAIPHNNEVAAKYADKGVVLIGACGGGGEETMGDVAKKHGVKYAVAKVDEKSTEAWNVQWWPTYAVMDRAGNVRAIGISPDAVDKVVDALLAAEKK